MGKGNVCVIYDPDERYAKRLMGIINDDKDIPYKARMFTRKEEFNKYIAGNDTDVLMVNEECYTYEIQKKSNNNVIVLCEEENEARRINDRKKEGHTGVCKYQPAYQLLGTISKKYTETEQNEKEKSFKCIGVYGFNSSLRVMLALVISAAFSRKGKTLFINLDEFSGIEHIMGSDESRNLSDALYMFKQAGMQYTDGIRRSIHFTDTDNYIEIKSKNTKHMWIISKPMPYIENKPIIIYHKHSQSVPYYHKHGYAYNIYQAVNSIKSHDEYVLSGRGKYNKA